MAPGHGAHASLPLDGLAITEVPITKLGLVTLVLSWNAANTLRPFPVSTLGCRLTTKLKLLTQLRALTPAVIITPLSVASIIWRAPMLTRLLHTVYLLTEQTGTALNTRILGTTMLLINRQQSLSTAIQALTKHRWQVEKTEGDIRKIDETPCLP